MVIKKFIAQNKKIQLSTLSGKYVIEIMMNAFYFKGLTEKLFDINGSTKMILIPIIDNINRVTLL